MKNLLFVFLMMINLSAAASEGVQLLCEDEYSEMVFDMLTEKTPGCIGDLIWGRDNICFEGSAEDLVYMMNSGYFNNISSGYRVSMARVTKDGVTYLGIDAQSFWQDRRLVRSCD